jgi:hypothetical protein
MKPDDFTDLVVPSLVGPLLAAGLASVAAAGAGVLLVQGRRIAPVLAGVSALPLLVAGGAAAWTDLGTREGVAVAIAQHLLTPLIFGMPACLALLLTAVGGGLHPPRRIGASVAGGVLVVAVIGLCVYAGQAISEPVFTSVRAVAYGMTGAFAVAALMGGGPEDRAGPESAAWAGVTWALCVAAGESSGRALAELQALFGLGGRPEAQRLEVARTYLDTVVVPHEPIAWAMFGVASLVALVGVSAAVAKGGTRAAGAAAALLWLGAGALVLSTAHPTAEQLVMAAGSDEPAVAAP